MTVAVLVFGVLAAVPAAAGSPITAGVTVTAVPASVAEGTAVTIEAVYDETGGEPTGRFRFRFDDGASEYVTPVDLAPTFAASVEHAFAREGDYKVVAIVPAGAAAYKGTVWVTVTDVAPVLDPIAHLAAGVGAPSRLGLSFSDPGTADLHRITVDWGDGTIDSHDLPVGERTPTVTHTYGRDAGPYTGSVTIADVRNGASSSGTFDVTITKVCAGRPVTIDMQDLGVTSVVGTPRDDVILGTPVGDIIDGRGGDDAICGEGGNDTIVGGIGDDTLRGGRGDDRLTGGSGNDSLDGSSGDDLLHGGAGNDVLEGGSGDDSIFGSAGDDMLGGGSGEDRLSGGSGNDDMDGGRDDDDLRGARGADVLRGADADDRLSGGPGDDVLLGGKGSDRLEGDGQNDVLHGGGGNDTLKGGSGTDLLFRSEYPDRDSMNGGKGDDAVRVGKRGTDASGIRRYVTESEALAFQGSYLLSEFTTYHNCCENRVVNIQLMADAVGGHIVMPGESFSVNAAVGRRTEAKGYKPAGAIIGGYVQCCNYPENIGGGTSQFATTFYNAVFFAAMEDVEHQPHTAWFSRYPQGREATMGYPHPDVKFRNNTDHPVLITTHHAGYRGGSIGVKFWGDNGHLQVTAGSKVLARYNKVVLWNVNAGLNHCSYPGPAGNQARAKRISIGTDGFRVEVYQHIKYPSGHRETNTTHWRYAGNYEVWEYNPNPPSGGCGGSTTPPPGTWTP